MNSKLPLYLALLTLTQCSSCKDGPGPNEQLPPATQEGRNTFGCRVNGQVWLPDEQRPPYSVVLYEPGASLPSGGNLNIQADRYASDGSFQAITLSAGPIRATGIYTFNTPGTNSNAYFDDTAKKYPCNDYGSPTIYRRGQVEITRLDERAGILSGTFEFTLAQPGCDTIKVTDGRFDYKL